MRRPGVRPAAKDRSPSVLSVAALVLTGAILAAAHHAIAGELAQGDLVAAVTGDLQPEPIAGAIVLMVLRFLLLFAYPVALLYTLAAVLLRAIRGRP